MKKLLIPLLALTAATAVAQTEVTSYTPGVTEEGITYFLPVTRLHITVTATRKSYSPGEYCLYAERFLRLKDVTTAPRDEWSLDAIAVTSYGEADKSQAYSIKLKQKTSAPLVGLAPDGRLLSVNTDAPAVARLSAPSVERDNTPRLNPEDFKTEEILSAGNTAKMAELTANEIYDIRENRSLLTKGQADFMPTDGEQLKLMLASLDKQEEALMQLFRGMVTTEKHVFTLDYTPETSVGREVLFRFSPYLGLVEADNLAGEPVYISVEDLQTLPEEVPASGKAQKKAVADLRYIVPGTAAVSLFTPEAKLFAGKFPLAQFGRVEHLGGELFNKKYNTRVLLSPETGGLVRIDADQP